MIGAYNIDNMLAAACIGLHFGISEADIDEALSKCIKSKFVPSGFI